MDKKTMLVRRHYEAYPYPSRKLINENSMHDYAKWILERTGLSEHDIKGNAVLEAGCGTGELSVSFALSRANVTAIDISRNSIEIGKETANKYNAKVEFLEQDILSMELKKRFDFVFSLGVLHHTINPKKAFSVLASHTKEGGTLCIGLYHSKGRVGQRLKRAFVGMLAPFGTEAREKAIELLYGRKQLEKRGKNYVYDKFLVPIESYHTEKEVKKWFHENGFGEVMIVFPEKGFFIASGKKG